MRRLFAFTVASEAENQENLSCLYDLTVIVGGHITYG